MKWLARLLGKTEFEDAGHLPALTNERPEMQKAEPARKDAPTLQQQIETLAKCGIRLRPGITAELLLKSREGSWADQDFRKNPYLETVLDFGDEPEWLNWQRVSDDLWHFDTECIEDHGDYVRITERIRDLTRGELPLLNIADFVDAENQESCWLEFDLDGERIHWDLKIEDDWVDPDIFGRFLALMAKRKCTRKLTVLDLQGQDMLIGCATPQELNMLRNLTGLRFQWLK